MPLPQKRSSPLIPTCFWLLGIALAFIPFWKQWVVQSIGFSLRQGSGNFGVNSLVGVALLILASLLWGSLGKWLGWLTARSSTFKKISFGILLAMLAWLITGAVMPQGDPYALPSDDSVPWVGKNHVTGQLLLLGVGFITALIGTWRYGGFSNTLPNALSRLTEKRDWNFFFYALLLVLLLTHNALVLNHSKEVSGAIFWSAFLGRIGTQIAFIGIIILLIRLIQAAGPTFLKWGVWILAGIIPALVIGDSQILLYWNRSLFSFFNALTDSGEFDVARELRAGGIKASSLFAYFVFVGGMAFSSAIALLLRHWSKKRGFKISTLSIFLIALGGLIFATAEQAIGKAWKPVAIWKEERKLFDIHLSPVGPPFGLAEFEVTFHKLELGDINPPIKIEDLPDIHIIMVETYRKDFMTEEFAPNLIEFQRDHAQEIEKTYSASNGTHLSWYSFFHSQLPVFWRKASLELEDENYRGSEPLNALKGLSYELQIRAGCELDYKAMGPQNFGKRNSLADFLRQSGEEADFEDMNLPERDRFNMMDALSEATKPASPHRIYFIGLESQHYNYYWHNDFDPPRKEYDSPIVLSTSPTSDEIQRAKNRFINSVACTDELIGEYLDGLKAAGKFDSSIIIITGDHGEEFQERGGWFHTSSLEAEQTEVPLLIKWPKSSGRGPAQSAASHLDVIPSLLAHFSVPPETLKTSFAGASLLSPLGSRTIIRATAYPGNSGECLLLSRDGYEAAFHWSRYWEADDPEEMTLLRFDGPDGPLAFESPEDYRAALEKTFPDLERYLLLK